MLIAARGTNLGQTERGGGQGRGWKWCLKLDRRACCACLSWIRRADGDSERLRLPTWLASDCCGGGAGRFCRDVRSGERSPDVARRAAAALAAPGTDSAGILIKAAVPCLCTKHSAVVVDRQSDTGGPVVSSGKFRQSYGPAHSVPMSDGSDATQSQST